MPTEGLGRAGWGWGCRDPSPGTPAGPAPPGAAGAAPGRLSKVSCSQGGLNHSSSSAPGSASSPGNSGTARGREPRPPMSPHGDPDSPGPPGCWGDRDGALALSPGSGAHRGRSQLSVPRVGSPGCGLCHPAPAAPTLGWWGHPQCPPGPVPVPAPVWAGGTHWGIPGTCPAPASGPHGRGGLSPSTGGQRGRGPPPGACLERGRGLIPPGGAGSSPTFGMGRAGWARGRAGAIPCYSLIPRGAPRGRGDTGGPGGDRWGVGGSPDLPG